MIRPFVVVILLSALVINGLSTLDCKELSNDTLNQDIQATAMQVIEIAFDQDQDNWSLVRTIAVKANGKYQIILHSDSEHLVPAESLVGKIDAMSVSDLRRDIVNSRGFRMIDGIATYRYYLDNNHVRHPASVKKFRQTIEENVAASLPVQIF